MVNRFEGIGIFLSVALMALALFLINLDATTDQLAPQTSGEETAAAAFLSEDDPASTLYNSVDTAGNLTNLVIDDVSIGAGREVAEGDTVSVHYIGTLVNGQQFDNSYLDSEPFEFTVGEGKVIAGWEEGVVGMKVGGQRILVIPPQLAYGSEQVGPIPADSTLVFAVELLNIEE